MPYGYRPDYACVDVCDAAARGFDLQVKSLLAGGGDADERDGSGWPALHLAADKGNVACLVNLLDGGADVAAKAPPPSSSTALHRALVNNHNGIVRLLVPLTADIDCVDGAGGPSPLRLRCVGDRAKRRYRSND